MTVTASLVVPLTGAPNAALECLVALTQVPDLPTHEVVIVDDASVGLEGLLASVEAGATVVRLPRRSGVAGALRAALGRAQGEVCVLLPGMPRVDPGFLAPLCAALADPAVAAATAGSGEPVAAPALAFRAADLAAGDVPDVADELLLGALTTRLARHGRVVPVAAARVASADARSAAGRDLQAVPPGTTPELTVVIPTLDAASDRLRRCVAAIQRCTTVPYEIVVVDNGAPPQGFTAPVNSGLRAARGAYAVVCNDDVEVLPGWWEPLRDTLDGGAAVAFPLTLDGFVREDFSAWCFALSRRTLEEHAVAPGHFLHPELVVWYQDTDLLQRLRTAGTPPVLVRASTIRHGLSETVSTADPALGAWIDRQVRRDHERFVALHGDGVAGAAPAGTAR
ncbi:glycosyltransferase [Patulibacter sp. SYSU D01012]|uniref:glycosyltransferase family 2 protein n=1 Tax=Patulibacter sp. SYSU D01012 TaxID=2817381 RepID=UPI001B318689|nr:glycosyltransferase [Patulibacter sp. SYSU D01012]